MDCRMECLLVSLDYIRIKVCQRMVGQSADYCRWYVFTFKPLQSSRLVMRKSRSDGTFVLAWIMFTVCIPSNSEALSAIRLLTKDLFGDR